MGAWRAIAALSCKAHAMEIQTVLLINDLNSSNRALCIQLMGNVHPIAYYTFFYVNNDPRIPFLDSLCAIIKLYQMPIFIQISMQYVIQENDSIGCGIFLTENILKKSSVASKSLWFTTHTFNMEKRGKKLKKVIQVSILPPVQNPHEKNQPPQHVHK